MVARLRTLWLALLLVLPWAVSAGVVQTITVRYVSAGSADATTFGSATTAGNAILIGVNTYNGGGSPDWVPTDDSSNTYVPYKSSAGDARTMWFLALNIAGKASQQITMTPDAAGSSFWQAWELSEVPTTNGTADTPVFYTDADSNPNASLTSGTPSQSGNIVFVAAGSRENFGTFTLVNASSGYTQTHLDTTQSGSSISSNMARKTGSGSAQTATWTHGTGSPGSAGMIILKQNAAAGGLLLRRRRQ